MKSPLVLGIPLVIAIAGLTWLLTELLSFYVPAKWRPATALLLGPCFGWLTQAAELLDFGAGPGSWLRAFLFGLLGATFAVLAHDHIKGLPVFRWLTTRTPSTQVPPAPPTPGGGTP